MVIPFREVVLLLGIAISAPIYVNARVLVDFQVAQPPPVPVNGQTCTMTILERTFRNSSGHPEIVQYIPPTDCGEPGSWAAVTLNFTATSNGTQYDRLGILTFQNTEIWRTSTPEPTRNGIVWTYIKDVTPYIPLFAKPGTVIFELDNYLENKLNGSYATTLYATFYAASDGYPTAAQSNLIVPISTMSNTSADEASFPPAFSLNITLPRNTVEIYAELCASGNGNEEFWYFNVPDKYLGDLPQGTTYGGGPFREVRLLVDGRLAGIAFPYATIFTGGISPSLWRPITSYGALDLPTYFLDLTPFAPTFADGLPHNITVDVASAELNHTLNQNWYISGLLQVVTDPSGIQTTGEITYYGAEPYATTETLASNGGTDVNVTVNAQHSVHIEAVVISGSGRMNNVSVNQDLHFTNTQYDLSNTTIQNVAQVSWGSVVSLHNGVQTVGDNFEYPLYANITYLEIAENVTTFYTTVDHSYSRRAFPAPFILGSTIMERQQAAGYYTIASTGNSGNGTNNNTFSYADTRGNTYNRNVNAAYNTIVGDQESGSLATSTPSDLPLEASRWIYP